MDDSSRSFSFIYLVHFCKKVVQKLFTNMMLVMEEFWTRLVMTAPLESLEPELQANCRTSCKLAALPSLFWASFADTKF